MNKLKNEGPKWNPYGTLDLIAEFLEWRLLNFTIWNLLQMKLDSQEHKPISGQLYHKHLIYIVEWRDLRYITIVLYIP